MEKLNIYQDVLKHFQKFNKEQRFEHSKNVVKMALKLNEIHKLYLKESQIILAGLLHDYAKAYPEELQKEFLIKQLSDGIIDANKEELLKTPLIWHGFICPSIINDKFKINDPMIDDAIFYHTTGKPKMNNLTKIIFLADYIEPSRTFVEAKTVREIAYRDLDEAVLKCLENTIEHLKTKQEFIYHLTLETYHYYQKRRKEC